MLLIFLTLLVFQKERSGRVINEMQLQNKSLILVIFPISHLEISGK